MERFLYGFFMIMGFVLGIDGLICAVLGRAKVGIRVLPAKTLYNRPARVLGGLNALCGAAIFIVSVYAWIIGLPLIQLLYLCLIPLSSVAIGNIIGIFWR